MTPPEPSPPATPTHPSDPAALAEAGPSARHCYRASTAHPEKPADVVMEAMVDLEARTVTVATPDQPALELDALTARALHLVLDHAVYDSLQPTGPRLHIEQDTGQGWRHVRELR